MLTWCPLDFQESTYDCNQITTMRFIKKRAFKKKTFKRTLICWLNWCCFSGLTTAQDSRFQDCLLIYICLQAYTYKATLWHHESYFDHAIIVRKHSMTSWHKNQCCKNTGPTALDRTEVNWWSLATALASVAHLSGRLWYRISARFHSILSAFLKERYNMAFFSNSDSRVPRLINFNSSLKGWLRL